MASINGRNVVWVALCVCIAVKFTLTQLFLAVCVHDQRMKTLPLPPSTTKNNKQQITSGADLQGGGGGGKGGGGETGGNIPKTITSCMAVWCNITYNIKLVLTLFLCCHCHYELEAVPLHHWNTAVHCKNIMDNTLQPVHQSDSYKPSG